jgi:3-oxoacyl-[acyl-carrier protein] reductase
VTGAALPLAGRTALVTGGSRGIGKSIAERLGSAGATVIVAARSLTSSTRFKGTVQETCELIESRGGRAIAMPLDLEDAASRRALIADTIARIGRLDILVNNAGTANYKKTDAMSLEEAFSQVQTYFLGPWDLCHQILPHMKANGRGWIVNVGSCAALPPTRPFAEYNAQRGDETLYATLKAAIHRFSTGLAAEVQQYNISVNVVAPVLAIFTPGIESLGWGLTADHDIMEAPEHIAEAALEMLCHEPKDHTGNIAFSYQYLDQIGRTTRSLDGMRVIQQRDAPAVTLDSTAAALPTP